MIRFTRIKVGSLELSICNKLLEKVKKPFQPQDFPDVSINRQIE